MTEVLDFVKDNDVKFIRLAFCDVFGTQKNISIMPDELPRAFEVGISFDASAIKGFMNVEESDLFLFPDPATLSILPWRPSHGRVVRFFCSIRHPDGTAFEGDGRSILMKAVREAEEMGYTCKIGSECEFYLFEVDDKGTPTKIPHDRGGYFDIAPMDKGENVRREICMTLEEMGIRPESSHHEQGPGQNEIDFRYGDALQAADNLVTFKSVVKTIAARNGLYASFMPKPILSQSGNGLHINLSLFKNGCNIFKSERNEQAPDAESFIAGVLDRACEMSVFLNPITNSYARLGSFEAPKYVTWSHQNRSQLIRIPAAAGEYNRMELRLPDPTCSPYLAFALLIRAGLEGIRMRKKICPSADFNLYEASPAVLQGIQMIPENLKEAVLLAKNSEFVNNNLPSKTLERYFKTKLGEWEKYVQADDKEKFEHDYYFYRV